MVLDNIIIGTLVDGLTCDDIGIGKEEETLNVTMCDALEHNMFLPKILVSLGLFKSTSDVRRIHKQRITSQKIKDSNSRDLWRTIDKPEMTHFKIGKLNFWLVVGE